MQAAEAVSMKNSWPVCVVYFAGSGGSTPVQDEDGFEVGSGQATPVRDVSPHPDSPVGNRIATEDDDYVSDGGEVEREVEQQEVEDDGEAEEVEREEVRTDGWLGGFKLHAESERVMREG